ncbi:PREDICTED: uncharacterized protein LOC108780209 [Cyphomyrmex costatus]|uniref:Uncharacterized protein n=1 Tax=Cyphomyrmex costatus TaxID=456900 RepID=A0A195D3Z4_9HYME|nr:PREDICTED: uncharacterized protein LOC108780209 [Cyphomyrmex costatus]KYN07608.1 hypothetical protein ALC62_01428 [Cyphomyrmex costatus]
MRKKHIDDVQPQTVDEHYKLILEDKNVIDTEATDVTSNDLPEWYNKHLYKEAQKFYERNLMSIIAASTVGLVIVFAVETILKVLLYTKKSSSTCSAFKRYIETILHTHNIYTCDPNDTDSKWYKSINAIRWHHVMATRMTKKAGVGEIQQRDMVLTQFGFLGYTFTASKYFGLNNTLEENEAFNHFWRVNGYMLGITDNLNICRKNAKETTELCYKFKDLYGTYLSNGSPEFHEIAVTTLNAIWYVDVTADIDSFMAFAYKLHGLPDKKLGWRSWLIMKYREWLFYLCLVPYIRVIVRAYSNLFVRIVLWNARYFPILAWINHGKDNVRLNLYPKH